MNLLAIDLQDHCSVWVPSSKSIYLLTTSKSIFLLAIDPLEHVSVNESLLATFLKSMSLLATNP
jgi:hypothetical protein